MSKHKVPLLPSSDSRWSEPDARAVLADWRQSGQSMAAYARDRSLHAQRLAWWHKRLNPWSSPAAIAPALSLVPAEIVAASAAPIAGLVRLPRGVVVEIAAATPTWIAALVAELEALG